MATFQRLVRFSQGTQKYYGELLDSQDGSYTIKKLLGSPFAELTSTEEIVTSATVSVTLSRLRHSLMLFYSS